MNRLFWVSRGGSNVASAEDSAVNHPQTNGKLERAFRDDMRDFYRQHTPWLLEPLRRDLPAYVHYRNHVRGHQYRAGCANSRFRTLRPLPTA